MPLSASGRQQAYILAEAFADIELNSVFCSPLLRTRQTAEAILSLQTNPAEIEIADFLREIDYGPDENQPEETVLARIGQDAMSAWETMATPPPDWLVDPTKIISDWARFFETINHSPNQNVLVMTSNGIARFVLDVVDKIPNDAPRKLKTGAFGVVEKSSQGTLNILNWNERPSS